jgi:hypothetical protein
MRIDWHVHTNDPKYTGLPWWQHPVPMSLENALEARRLAGLDWTVISNAVHYIRFCETRKEVAAATAATATVAEEPPGKQAGHRGLLLARARCTTRRRLRLKKSKKIA